MNFWLIKRSPSLTNDGLLEKRTSKQKTYSESRITASSRGVLPKKFKVGDTVYLSETGWGIYGTGTVTHISELKIAHTTDDLVDLMLADCRKNEVYWANKIQDFRKETKTNPEKTFRYIEYEIDQKLVPRPIPLTGALDRLSKPGLMSSIIELRPSEVEFIKTPDFSQSKLKLSEHIPNSLRRDLWGFFNTTEKVQHYIDIDHFVPKSVGGPGNLIENLVPIGFSLNRYKSNSIPRGFFLEAQKNSQLKNLLSEDHTQKGDYIKDKAALHDATRINAEVWSWESETEIQNFYRAVMKHHLESYVEVIDAYKKQRGF